MSSRSPFPPEQSLEDGLMAKKIAVSPSASGEMPEPGLEILNQEDDSTEMALAKIPKG